MASEASSILELIVAADQAGQRLDLFLAAQLQMTRSQAQKLIQGEAVTVNGHHVRAKDPMVVGALVRVAMPEAESRHSETVAPVALDIVFEDEELLVVNKPAGLIVHPGAGTREATLFDALKAHLGPKAFSSPDFKVLKRPGIVHRLDKDTSGLLVCAKTVLAHQHLSAQFQAKTNLREYVALLDGYMEHQEMIHCSYLTRDPRYRTRFTSVSEAAYAQLVEKGADGDAYRFAKSVFLRRKTYGKRLTLAFVRLYTGRTHQIRLHARDLRMPIVGDLTYHHPLQLPTTFPDAVREGMKKISQQLLHARILGFQHPTTGRHIAFEAPMPDHFRKALILLEESRGLS